MDTQQRRCLHRQSLRRQKLAALWQQRKFVSHNGLEQGRWRRHSIVLRPRVVGSRRRGHYRRPVFHQQRFDMGHSRKGHPHHDHLRQEERGGEQDRQRAHTPAADRRQTRPHRRHFGSGLFRRLHDLRLADDARRRFYRGFRHRHRQQKQNQHRCRQRHQPHLRRYSNRLGYRLPCRRHHIVGCQGQFHRRRPASGVVQ